VRGYRRFQPEKFFPLRQSFPSHAYLPGTLLSIVTEHLDHIRAIALYLQPREGLIDPARHGMHVAK
jgi:hypothetical protein